MQGSLLEKITIEKTLIYIAIIAIIIVFVFVFYLFISRGKESIEIISPSGGEEWELGQTYKISWKSKGVERVGIVLFKGAEPKWIAQNVPAGLKEYEWTIHPGQQYGDDYWVAVFDYPWRKGSAIDYSKGAFSIFYPELASCDFLSVKNEWPYLQGNLADLRRVFITEKSYDGNLGGFEGADKKCQQEADEKGYGGKWSAFLGGDSDEDSAAERLKRTPRQTNGIFIYAAPAAALISQETCHRLLAKDFDEFLKRFSGLLIIKEEKLEKKFLEDMRNLWLGRIDENSKKNCLSVAEVMADTYRPLSEKYSFTVTCQNWTQGAALVEGYPIEEGLKTAFPACYTLEGVRTDAVALAGLSSGLLGSGKEAVLLIDKGKYCSVKQKLLCIEE